MQVQAEEAVAAHVKSNGEQATKLLGDKGIAPAGDPQIDTATHTIVVKVADAGRATHVCALMLNSTKSPAATVPVNLT